MKALALFLALASIGRADVYNRGVSWTSKNAGSVGEAAALNMGYNYATGLWAPVPILSTTDYANLTKVAGCQSSVLYQVHKKITATTGTGTYLLASPTAAGKSIVVKAFHIYNSQCTASGGAIVSSFAYGSFSGLTVSANSYFCPNAAPASDPFGQLDEDDNMWGPCGWPLPANDQVWWNLSNALTGGEWYVHMAWFER